MKNKLLVLLLAFVLLLAACGKDNQIAQTTESESIVVTTQTVETTQEISETVDSSIEKTITKTSTKNTTKASTKPESEKPSETTQITSVVTETTKRNVPNKTETTQTALSTVTISVECKNAINYGILSVGTFAQVLPSDGIILPLTSVEIVDGDNVMITLKKVLKQNNIACIVTSSGYVRSISGLAEFDCGPSSGWMYKVNGVLPSVSTKGYPLHNGDKIEFIYTCVQGDV